eukprot:g37751.t1
MDNQVLAYKDLAAIPKDKAILEIERPDLMIYEPHYSYFCAERPEPVGSAEVSNKATVLKEFSAKSQVTKPQFPMPPSVAPPHHSETQFSLTPSSIFFTAISLKHSASVFWEQYMVHKESREWADGKSPGSTMGSASSRRSYPSTGSLPHHFHRP